MCPGSWWSTYGSSPCALHFHPDYPTHPRPFYHRNAMPIGNNCSRCPPPRRYPPQPPKYPPPKYPPQSPKYPAKYPPKYPPRSPKYPPRPKCPSSAIGHSNGCSHAPTAIQFPCRGSARSTPSTTRSRRSPGKCACTATRASKPCRSTRSDTVTNAGAVSLSATTSAHSIASSPTRLTQRVGVGPCTK